MRTLILFLLGALVSLPLCALGVGDVAPDVQFSRTWNMPGGERKLSQFAGKVVFIEMWGTL